MVNGSFFMAFFGLDEERGGLAVSLTKERKYTTV
jgi:hypothetical protein